MGPISAQAYRTDPHRIPDSFYWNNDKIPT